jgi:hypothetical protein
MMFRRLPTAILLLLLLATCTIAKGDLVTRGLKSNQASKRNSGSARRLSGTILIQQIFVSDRESSWTDDEKANVRRKVDESLIFITRHARQYGQRVQFATTITPQTVPLNRVPLDTFVDPEWTETAIRTGCGMSSNDLVLHLRREYRADNVLLCLHANRSALSYNLAHYADVEGTYQAERMICYTHYPDGRETATATYAHEILHLFGAGDLYFPYDRLQRRRRLARQYFPNDIMLRVDYDLNSLNVGSFTAYRVGWTNGLERRFSLFEDRG